MGGERHGFTPVGASLALKGPLRPDAALFGESASRALFSVSPDKAKAFLAAAKAGGVPVAQVGQVGGARLAIRTAKAGLSLGLAELKQAYTHAFTDLA